MDCVLKRDLEVTGDVAFVAFFVRCLTVDVCISSYFKCLTVISHWLAFPERRDTTCQQSAWVRASTSKCGIQMGGFCYPRGYVLPLKQMSRCEAAVTATLPRRWGCSSHQRARCASPRAMGWSPHVIAPGEGGDHIPPDDRLKFRSIAFGMKRIDWTWTIAARWRRRDA